MKQQDHISSAKKVAKSALPWSLLSLAVLFFAILFVRYWWWQNFHSDAAIAYELAQTVLRTGELMPSDFAYGNDIFFLHPHFMIAIFLALGLDGYAAYGAGIAVMLTFAFMLVVVVLSSGKSQNIPRAVAIAFLAFLPLGYVEWDFIWGQQSHLFRVVFAALAAYCMAQYVMNRRPLSYGVASLVFVALIVADSPLRGATVGVALLVVCLLTDAAFMRRLRGAIFSFAGLILGVGIYSLLTLNIEVLGIGEKLSITGTDALLTNWSALLQDFYSSVGGLGELKDQNVDVVIISSVVSKMILSTGLLLSVLIFAWLPFSKVVSDAPTTKHHDANLNNGSGAFIFIGSVGALTVIAALIIMINTSVDNISRNLLHGIWLVKLALVGVIVARFRFSLAAGSLATLGVGALFLAASPFPSSLASPSLLKKQLQMRAEQHATLKLIRSTNELFQEGPLFGNFWDVYKWDVLADLPRDGAAILADTEDSVLAYRWLVDLTRYCPTPGENAAYIIKKEQVQYFQQIAARASQAIDLGGYTLYIENSVPNVDRMVPIGEQGVRLPRVCDAS